jgi:glycosyltransferase A (GT-A) superfamily protein (DUF2064 family)
VSVGLAIFVKTPGRSGVKTRLAAGMGDAFALAWHRRAAAAVAAVARDAEQRSTAGNPLRAYWAVAEAAAIVEGDWPGLPNLAQEEGGLGERMARIYSQLYDRHRAGLLIGADAPQLRSDYLVNAAQWLDSEEPRLVIGPARDGGFWLFGGNCPIPMSAWTDVIYSRSDTEQRFCAGLAGKGELWRLPMLSDLDRAEDIPFVQAELDAMVGALPEQRAIGDWLSTQSHSQKVE